MFRELVLLSGYNDICITLCENLLSTLAKTQQWSMSSVKDLFLFYNFVSVFVFAFFGTKIVVSFQSNHMLILRESEYQSSTEIQLAKISVSSVRANDDKVTDGFFSLLCNSLI